MFTPKFITEEDLGTKCPDQTIVLDSAESKHAAALRVNEGAEVRIYSLPLNCWFEGIVAEYRASEVTVRITKKLVFPRGAIPRIQLIIGTPSTATLDTIVQHTTEIGVASIILYRAERTQFKLDEAAQEKVLKRLQKIAIAAIKQSGAARLPNLAFDKKSLPQIVDKTGPTNVFLGSLASNESLAKILLKNPRLLNQFEQNQKTDDLISVVIGPEGGLSDAEEKSLIDRGVTPFSLGPAALRVETACIVTTGILNSFIEAGKFKDEVP